MDEELQIQEEWLIFNGLLRTGFHWCNFKRGESGIEGIGEPRPQLSDRLARLAQLENGMRDEWGDGRKMEQERKEEDCIPLSIMNAADT